MENNFTLTTTDVLQGAETIKYLDVLNINIVLGTNIFSDTIASITDLVGGTSSTYQNKLEEMRVAAQRRIVTEAKRKGANAIIGFSLDFDEISGKGKSMFMLRATGTACDVTWSEKLLEMEKKLEGTEKKVSSRRIEELRIIGIVLNCMESGDDLSSSITDKLTIEPIEELAEPIFQFLTDVDKPHNQNTSSYLYNHKAFVTIWNFLPNEAKMKAMYSQHKNKLVFKHIYDDAKYNNLFDSEGLLQLIKSDNMAEATSLLDIAPTYYTVSDLINLKAIVNVLDNLPDTGQIVDKKSLLGTSKVFLCENGHKSDVSHSHCPECDKSIKGLTWKEERKVERFKKLVAILENEIGEL